MVIFYYRNWVVWIDEIVVRDVLLYAKTSGARGVSLEEIKIMKLSAKIAAGALLGLSALALTATTASAAIACNGEGYCWHVRRAYAYSSGYGVVVHPDNWRWGPNEHFAWREHAGRGYWRNGAWITF